MQEALQAAQDLASQSNHPEITNEHFLSALLDQSESIARPLLEKIGANVDQLQERLRSELERRPKIHGAAADLRSLKRASQRAGQCRKGNGEAQR